MGNNNKGKSSDNAVDVSSILNMMSGNEDNHKQVDKKSNSGSKAKLFIIALVIVVTVMLFLIDGNVNTTSINNTKPEIKNDDAENILNILSEE